MNSTVALLPGALRRIAARRLPWLLAVVVVLPACVAVGTANAPPAVRLSATGEDLKNAAIRVLKAGGVAVAGEGAPLLVLRESVAEKTSSIAGDGSVAAYWVTYNLHYRVGDGEEKIISRERTVSHNENRYLAGRQQRLSMVKSLRRNALTRLLYVLPRQ